MQPTDQSKSILIITGMHRSGTSLTSSLLESAGLDIGKRLMGSYVGNLKGHFENLDFVEFHESVLHSQGLSKAGWTLENTILVTQKYVDKAKEIIEQNKSKNIWGWKDPRTTLFLDFWADLLPESKFLFTYRSPAEVVDSLYRRGDEEFSNNPALAVELWMHYNKKILNLINKYPNRCLLLSIYSITKEPKILLKALEEKFDIFLERVQENIYEEKLLNTFRNYHSDLIKYLFPEALNIYEELNAKAEYTNNYNNFCSESNDLSAVKTLCFQDWIQLRWEERKHQKTQSQLQQTQAELEQLQSLLKNNQIDREQSQSKLEKTQKQLEQSHLDLQQSHTQQKELEFKLQQSHTQQEELEFKLQQSYTQQEELEHQLEQTQLKFAQSQSNLINAQNIITAMESSKFWQLRLAWFKIKKKFNLVSESEIYPFEGNVNQQIIQGFSKTDKSNNQAEKRVNVSKMFAFISGCPGDAYRYRCHNQAEILKHLGYSVDVYLGDRFPYEQLLKNYQVIIAHRVPYTKEFEQFVNQAKKLNKIVIFDTDDLVFDPSKLNQIDAYNKMDLKEKQLYESGVRRYRKALELCDAVIVSTDKLKKEVEQNFPNKTVVISRNIISDEMEEEAIKARELYVPKDNKIRIAYFSGTRTHAKDFAECVSALKTILKEYSHVVLMVVGHLDIPEELQEFSSQIEIFPLVPWQDLPELYRKVDINIAPLEKNNDFTESKSELKYFEAGLVSVPTVASDVGAYRFAIKDRVNGILCSTTDEWEAALREMVINTELRNSLAQKAFEQIKSRYLTRTATAVTLELWQKLLKQQEEIATQNLSIAFVVRAPIAQTGGGYKHIFYLAHHLANQGNKVDIYVEPIAHLAGLSLEEIRNFCEKHFGKSKAVIHCGHDNIQKSDIAIATNWPTAYVVNKLVNTNFKAYYVQDYEPSFYESEDSYYTSAEKTYDLPLGIICLGKYLSEILSTRNRIKYPYIDFPLNPAFLSQTPNLNRHLDSEKDCSVLFFARPHIPRRNFALGVEVLKKLHLIRPDVKIKLYGMEEAIKLPFKYENLGILSQSEIVDAMYSSEIHISFSMTNISTVVFEAMACGCATIEADVLAVRSMVEDNKNCLLVQPTSSAFLEALISLVDNYEFRYELAKNGYELVKKLSVENMCQQFENLLNKYSFRGD